MFLLFLLFLSFLADRTARSVIGYYHTITVLYVCCG